MREQLKKTLDEKIENLVSKGVDRKDIDELLSLKGQYDVVPTEVDIPVEEVVKRYKITEAWEIVRCRTAIFFHSTCFWVISQPTLANGMKGGALYQTLEWWCDYQDGTVDNDEAARDTYDVISQLIIHILSLPLDVFYDMDMCIDIATYILEKRSEFFRKIEEEASKPHVDTKEDAIANAVMEALAEGNEEMRDAVLAAVEKKKGRLS